MVRFSRVLLYSTGLNVYVGSARPNRGSFFANAGAARLRYFVPICFPNIIAIYFYFSHMLM